MTRTCPVCLEKTAEGGRFCPVCGGLIDPYDREGGPDGASVALSGGLCDKPVPAGSAGYRDDGAAGARFVPVKEIGRGGFGAVFEAVDLSAGGRRVALKRLFPQKSGAGGARIEEEAGILARLKHHGVIRYFSCGSQDGAAFMACALLKGASARTFFNGALAAPPPSGRLPWPVSLADQLLDALCHSHCLTAHLDLKPENIFIEPDGAVVLLDFGLAGIADFRAQGRRMLGTAYYVAPEVISGGPVIGYRADVYSAAVVIYEAFTGRLPVGSWSFRVPAAAGMSRRFEKELRRALDPSPASRTRNAFELHARLVSALPGFFRMDDEIASSKKAARGGNAGALLKHASLLEAAGEGEKAQGVFKKAAKAGEGTLAGEIARECLGYPPLKPSRFCILCGIALSRDGRRSSLCGDCRRGRRRSEEKRPIPGESLHSALLRGPRGGAAVLRFAPGSGLAVAASPKGEIFAASLKRPPRKAGKGPPPEWTIAMSCAAPFDVRDADIDDDGRIIVASGEGAFRNVSGRENDFHDLEGGKGSSIRESVLKAGETARGYFCCALDGAGFALFANRRGDVEAYSLDEGGGPMPFISPGPDPLALADLGRGRIAAFTRQGAWMISGSDGSEASGAFSAETFFSAGFARDKPLAAAAGTGGGTVLDLKDGKVRRAVSPSRKPLCAAMDPAGGFAVFGTETGGVIVSGALDKDAEAPAVETDGYPVLSVAVSPDGRWIAASTMAGGIWFFETAAAIWPLLPERH